MPNRGIRAANRARIEAEILSVATEHLAREGAAGLSLRAIAREMGMASSAIYRYIDTRDELLTRLIVAAYNDLGNAVDAALVGIAGGDEQFVTIGRVLRTWALAHPEQYALVYGSPVPGYHAPTDRTNAAGSRVTDRLQSALALSTGDGLDHSEALTRGVAAWAMVTGAVTAEVFQQYGPDFLTDPAAHFERVLRLALRVTEGA